MAAHRPLRGDDALQESLTTGSVFGPVQIDECDPEIWAHHLAQLRRGLGHDDLQRGEHQSLEEVTSARRPVRQPQDDMHVPDGAVLALGDVTDQRQHLALLVDRDAAVLLSRTVEPADGGAFKAPMAVTWEASSRSARTNCASAAAASSPGSHSTT